MTRKIRRALASVALLVASALPSPAQELTPRAHWPAPIGTKVVSVGYSYQKGDVVTDPSLPVEGVQSASHALQVGYTQFFRLAGRTTSVSLELPWVQVSFNGELEGEATTRQLEGFSDTRLRLAMNLRGAPAMTPEEFRAFTRNPKPLFGVSLRVQSQTGQYTPSRFLNLGSNRWAVKPDIGYLRKIRPGWIVEMSLGAWFFEDNKDFLDQLREQDPLAAGEFHLVRQRPSGAWASLDLNFYGGGQTRVEGEASADRQSNSRIGVTLLFPFKGQQALRFAASTSLVTEAGGHYDSYIVAYVKAWR